MPLALKDANKAKPRLTHKRQYLKDGVGCPFCQSEDVVGDCVDIVGNTALQDYSCSSCKKKWVNAYVLRGVYALTQR